MSAKFRSLETLEFELWILIELIIHSSISQVILTWDLLKPNLKFLPRVHRMFRQIQRQLHCPEHQEICHLTSVQSVRKKVKMYAVLNLLWLPCCTVDKDLFKSEPNQLLVWSLVTRGRYVGILYRLGFNFDGSARLFTVYLAYPFIGLFDPLALLVGSGWY